MNRFLCQFNQRIRRAWFEVFREEATELWDEQARLLAAEQHGWRVLTPAEKLRIAKINWITGRDICSIPHEPTDADKQITDEILAELAAEELQRILAEM